jgi:hypothetical protein
VALKKYKLTPQLLSTALMRGDGFRCKLVYSRNNGDGSTTYAGSQELLVQAPDVVGTTNIFTQSVLEKMVIPTTTKRNGVAHTTGFVFQEFVGGAPVTMDLDLVLV